MPAPPNKTPKKPSSGDPPPKDGEGQNKNGRICSDLNEFRTWDPDTNSWKYTVPDTLPQRPAKLNTQGKPINITLNTFNVNGFPTTVVHQYDVSNMLTFLIFFKTDIACRSPGTSRRPMASVP